MIKMPTEDLENIDLFLPMVHNNPRRQGITRTVGIIVPEEDARCYAAYKAGCQQGGKWQGIFLTVIATLAVIGMTIAALL